MRKGVVRVLVLIGVVFVGVGLWLSLSDGVELAPDLERETVSLDPIKPFDLEGREQRISDVLRFGESITIIGSLEVIIIDDFDNQRAETQHFIIEDDGKRSRLYLFGDAGLSSGARVEVQGNVLRDGDKSEMVVRDYTIIDPGYSGGYLLGGGEENPNLGEQKTLVLLVNFEDNPSEPITIEEAWDRVFEETNYDSMNSWVKEVSYDKAWLSGDVFGWYTSPTNQDDDCFPFSEVIDMADPDIYFPDYTRLIFVVIFTEGCRSGATLGMTTIYTDDGPVNLSLSSLNGPAKIDNGVGNHELGHNFGLHHASDLECGSETIGIIGLNCEVIEYGDMFDVMGSSFGKGHFRAIRKEKIDWFEPSNIIETTEWGSYIIEPIENLSSEVQTLKIPLGDGKNYYVEYKRPVGYDAINSDMFGVEIYDGAMIGLSNFDFFDSNLLLDTTPHETVSQSFDSRYVVLEEGETFYDSDNDVVITTLNVTDEFLEVYLGRINCGDGVTDIVEDCDGENLDGNTCWSVGYQGGELGCTIKCRFDISQCGESICPLEHEFLGGNSCRAVFKSDPEDTFVTASGFEDWDELRNAASGLRNEFSWLFFMHLISGAELDEVSQITRISIPFDTSLIPDNSRIDSGEVRLRKSLNYQGIINTHPNSDDFLTLVPTSLVNPPNLTGDDFDQFSFVNDPEELANRVDMSELENDNIVFSLNDDGLANVNIEGYSGFGLRGGYDLFTTPNDEEYTELKINIFSSDSSDSSIFHAPRLIVDYTVQIDFVLFDMNGDGFRSIIGDVPPFVDCAYFNDCYCPAPGCDLRGDGNGDGFLSIIGDVPPFVDCIYFGNCPDPMSSEWDGFRAGGQVYSDANDPLQNGVSGIIVEADNVGTFDVYTTTTDEEGLWIVPDILHGTYEVNFYCSESHYPDYTTTIVIDFGNEAQAESINWLSECDSLRVDSSRPSFGRG